MRKILLPVLAALATMFVACGKPSTEEPTTADARIDYADTTYWYAYGDTQAEADIFYVYPTVSTLSFAENDSSWFADISLQAVREEANDNLRFNKMLYADYNFYAPYYRQMIFETYSQAEDVQRECIAFASQDVKDAFQYYMAHANGGRPFFLVGHSQGSQMLIELLKDGMTAEQRSLMICAYCIGFRITADEMAAYPQLQPVSSPTDLGHVALFNSVALPEATAMVSEGDVAGVNPLRWDADTTFAEAALHLGMAKYNDSRDSILFVPVEGGAYLHEHVTVCPGVDPGLVFIPAYEAIFPYGNLHFADSWLFGGNVVANMRERFEAYLMQ